jgi:predicted dinucleotide-utilizing enzyme
VTKRRKITQRRKKKKRKRGRKKKVMRNRDKTKTKKVMRKTKMRMRMKMKMKMAQEDRKKMTVVEEAATKKVKNLNRNFLNSGLLNLMNSKFRMCFRKFPV